MKYVFSHVHCLRCKYSGKSVHDVEESCGDLKLNLRCFLFAGVVSGAAEESAGGKAEAEGGRAEQTLCDDLHDPQPQQQEDQVWRRPVALRDDALKWSTNKNFMDIDFNF